MTMSTDESPAKAVPNGVRYARWIGILLGIALLAMGLRSAIANAGTFEVFKGWYWIVYALLLVLPFSRIDANTAWRVAFVALLLFSAGFVFVMIASVMFDYMAARERGEWIGVPGWQGTFIFIALMQVPAVLFQRKPDLLD